jgi:Pathogenicity locus
MNAPARQQRRQQATRVAPVGLALSDLRNVGKAALADFQLLGIETVEQLAAEDADRLYDRLCALTNRRHDPCVHDVFSATIHQARTGEALDWWAFTPARKARPSPRRGNR